MNLAHLDRLMGPHGLFEHARHDEPRRHLGYCTDDNARAVVVLAPLRGAVAGAILERCVRFVASGWTPEGWHNRMSAEGEWLDRVGSEDAHGRALWGLGRAAAHDRLPSDLGTVFGRGAQRRLEAPRAVAYALLGASAAVAHRAVGEAARRAIALLSASLPPIRPGDWMWPEARLTYDNARIPQAMMLVGHHTGDMLVRNMGLELLDWLVEVEYRHDRFSFTPTGGRGPGERGPAFDQQPIEAWAMAEACETAHDLTGDREWRLRALAAAEWFDGRNDSGVVLWDRSTGAGYDGLEAGGVNLNRGAESTLAALGAAAVRDRLSARHATGIV